MARKQPSDQRRRPRQARSRATWEAIVEAAAQILERRGPAGFTTNEVAERAGVSIGTLYQYFADKHALLAAAARRELGAAAPLAGRQRALIEKTRDYSITNIAKGIYPQLDVNGTATYQSTVTSLSLPPSPSVSTMAISASISARWRLASGAAAPSSRRAAAASRACLSAKYW